MVAIPMLCNDADCQQVQLPDGTWDCRKCNRRLYPYTQVRRDLEEVKSYAVQRS